MAGRRAGGSKSSSVENENWDVVEDDATPARALRRRSHSQIMPYTTEKINHKRALQGKPKRREGSDYDALQLPRSSACQRSPGYTGAKRRRTSSRSDNQTLPPSGTQQHDATQAAVTKRTRFNTRLTTALIDVPEVVYLEDTPSVEALLDEVTQAWHSKIPIESEVKLALRFPWLDEIDTSSTLSVRRDRPRSFDRMLEMISQAPCWEEGSTTECVVNVHVKIE